MNKLVLVGVLALAHTAHAEDAQVAQPPQKVFGVDAAFVLPTGDYAEVVDPGGGALVRLEFPVGPGFAYGRSGLLGHMVEGADATLLMVPIYAGYRHPFGDAYVAGELGITWFHLSGETQFGQMSDSDTELGFMLSAGWRRGNLDLRGGLFWPDDDAMGLMASAGFNFANF